MCSVMELNRGQNYFKKRVESWKKISNCKISFEIESLSFKNAEKNIKVKTIKLILE